MIAPGKIKKLDTVVVNRIAAGEVIQRPANALKELIENSLDAKATNIQIIVKEGGLKLLQIQDNGTGIRKDDLEIVCERFTTSKLQTFEDLQSISTFGFRGEALASISHVALLTITTKTADEKCAYKAPYIDSKLKATPKPCAGNQGTTIMIENLFYNVATRRKALSNTCEEFNKITDVVTKYAIHNPMVGFVLKKHGEITPQVRTPHNSTKMSNTRILYGNRISRELLEVELTEESYKFKMHALITNPNYSCKRMVFLLFINNRLVDSSSIRKMLEELYAFYLPKKTHPWCYISLEIDAQNVDVNVHPTKHEVKFLHESSIIERIKFALDEKLSGNSASRTFYVQARLPKADITKEVLKEVLPEYEKDNNDKTRKIRPQDMIRTDSADQKLDKFNFTIHASMKRARNEYNNETDELESISDNLTKEKSIDVVAEKARKRVHQYFGNKNTMAENKSAEETSPSRKEIKIDNKIDNNNKSNKDTTNVNTSVESKSNRNDSINSKQEFKSYSVNNFRREVKLTSILRLRKEVEDECHEGLREILSNLTFVGCIDQSSALVQSGVNLYLCNTKKLAEELFYEIMLYDFANHGVIKFSDAIPLYELAMLGLDTEEAMWTEEDGEKSELATSAKELLLEKADMLKEYFSIVIDKQGKLKSLPVLLEKYFPHEAGLPLYVLRLATEVNWSSEEPCFRNICRETAKYYSQMNPVHNTHDWRYITEHVLYFAIRESLLPPKHFTHDSTILQIASLPDLYKVFERC
ncbi:DNA mismatch repair protein Mlh1 isoform X2 [Colletes gigas]|uniref:DNA mismatch repair protein Mlh1 isoform X2 n=1 Tax=Colletes gigas TaxID=935657 RepID=UPI001C9B9474|nr:DNA mismatch repair protein Mlh1 isoform X2 [Colletes gigas]